MTRTKKVAVPLSLADLGLDILVDETVAAAVLGLAPGTLRNKRWQGTGPEYYKMGDGPGAPVRYSPRILQQHRESRRRKSTSGRSRGERLGELGKGARTAGGEDTGSVTSTSGEG